jgi:hypothetical protein
MPVPDFSPGEVLTAAAMDSIGLWKVAQGSFTTQDLIADGVFSTTYDRYLVKTSIALSDTAASVQTQFRTAGSNNATSNYVHQNTGFTTVAFFNRNTVPTTSSMIAQGVGAQGWDFDLTVWYPASATKPTRIHLTGGVDTGSLPIIGDARFNLNTAFDGIRIFPSSGTITGTYCIYGYRD